jgi:hypothetical protein
MYGTGMTTAAAHARNAQASQLPAADEEVLGGPDAAALDFVTEMYGVQLNQLAALLAHRGEATTGGAADRAGELVARWRVAGLAETGQLSLGQEWVWASRKALRARGLPTKLVRPQVHGLRHTHAVTDVRLAVERATAWRDSGARWRAERSMRIEVGYSPTEHVPDGEAHYPGDVPSPWAGEIWAVEVEISAKTVARTAEVMLEVLTRTGDYDRDVMNSLVPETRPRYARLVYVCSPKAARAALSARAELGSPLSARIDIYNLPESALRLNSLKRGWEP